MKTDPWRLLEAGDYIQAIELYLESYRRTQNISDLNNCGLGYMLLKDYSSALDCYKTIMERQEPRLLSQGEFVDAGICSWCLERPIEALEWWNASFSAPYVDAAGGFEPIGMLYFASVRLFDKELLTATQKK